jgi:hypothetical protein
MRLIILTFTNISINGDKKGMKREWGTLSAQMAQIGEKY